MPDYEKTIKFFETNNYTDHLKKDPPAWKMEFDNLKNWRARITEPSTGKPRKDPEHPDIEFPRKSVTTIKRVMTSKGEYLLSNQRWIGRTSLQNNLPINIDNFEMYDEPIFQSAHKLDPKDPNNIITEIVGVDSWVRHYTLENTPDNLQTLLNMSDPMQPPNYVAADFRVTGSGPREIMTLEDLRDKKFEELISPPQISQPQPNTQPGSPPGTARVTRAK